MKGALSIITILILGVCEYAFVEYYPLSPESRLEKLEQVPGIGPLVTSSRKYAVQRTIAESDSGFVFVYRNQTMTKWSDADKLFADAEAGDWAAKTMLYQLRNLEKVQDQVSEVKRKAELGDPSSMLKLYYFGKTLTGGKDMASAIELLESHDTAVAKSILYHFIEHYEPLSPRESLLLLTQVAIENYRRPEQSTDDFAIQTANANRSLRKLENAANDGDEDSVWVISQIQRETD